LPDWLDQMKARQRLYDPQPRQRQFRVGHASGFATEAGQQDAPLMHRCGIRLHSRSWTACRGPAPVAAAPDRYEQHRAGRSAELAVRARAWERRATIGYWVAIAAIALSVLAALSQIYLSLRCKAASDQWQDRVEGVISEQRNELKALREQNQSLHEQNERDNAALRDQLAKKATPPIAAPPAVAATPAPKGTKPAPAAKHGQKAGR
jgi:hypothetical protein